MWNLCQTKIQHAEHHIKYISIPKEIKNEDSDFKIILNVCCHLTAMRVEWSV